MDLFKEYKSNTVHGSSNNNLLLLDTDKEYTGMMFVLPREFGAKKYRLLFSNTVDSTFDHGEVAYANLKGEDWRIKSLSVADGGLYGSIKLNFDGANTVDGFSTDYCDGIEGFTDVLFGGSDEATVPSGEYLWSDEFEFDLPKDHYLALKITFSGTKVPYTSDKIIPCFMQESGKWKLSRDFPQPVFFGVKDEEKSKKRIGFLGDSITQGLGTTVDAYEYWVADIAEALPCDRYAVWDLGLGFGRAEDAASRGVWLERAKNNDVVFVCFGVNDILQYCDEGRICRALDTIVTELKSEDRAVGIFTIPPFDYEGESIAVYDKANAFIRDTLSKKADYFFDIAKVLCAPDDHVAAPHGGHPDKIGCRMVADAFLKHIKL